jgi:hypothetical protein
MNSNVYTHRLMPALFLFAVSTLSYAGVFHGVGSALHLRPAIGQAQANADTKPSTTPPASTKRHAPVTVKNHTVADTVSQPAPADPKPDGALKRRHEPVTVLTDSEDQSQTNGTIHIPTKPPHGEDNPALLKQDTTSGRTGPCPPHVVCADSGPEQKAVIPVQPKLPGAPGTVVSSAPQPHGTSPAAPWSQTDKKKFYDTADMVKARIGSSPVEGKALLGAVRSNDMGQIRSVLLRNGFTSQQIEGARFVLHDNTGGRFYPGKIKVELSPDCCPLTLVITITF